MSGQGPLRDFTVITSNVHSPQCQFKCNSLIVPGHAEIAKASRLDQGFRPQSCTVQGPDGIQSSWIHLCVPSKDPYTEETQKRISVE
jgi:hypothetical protein